MGLPLAVIAILSIFSMLGLGNTSLGEGSLSLDPVNAVYYDVDGNPKIYVSNLTAVDPNELMRLYEDWLGGGYAYFQNVSDHTTAINYPLYYDATGMSQVKYEDLGETQTNTVNFDISSSIGLIALIVGLMAIATVVGIRVLGSGVSDVSVSTLILGTSYLAVWGVFSVLALELILAINLLGPILYFALTILYTIGIISSLNGGGSSD